MAVLSIGFPLFFDFFLFLLWLGGDVETEP
jgi:hypothetical protein